MGFYILYKLIYRYNFSLISQDLYKLILRAKINFFIKVVDILKNIIYYNI